MSEVKDKLLIARDDGRFLEVVGQMSLQQYENSPSIAKVIADLHNDGEIDVIAEFRKLTKDRIGLDFFSVRNIFGNVLPELNAPVISVMDCTKHLVAESGEDMSATSIFESFVQYCEADRSRPKEVLKIVENSGDEWLEFIPLAIIAGSKLQLQEYVAIAITLSSHGNIEVKIRAVISFEKINYRNDKELLNNVLQTLETMVQSEDDDRLMATVIKSAFPLYIANENLQNRVVDLIQTALSYNGDYSLLAASKLFAFRTDSIPEPLFDVLLEVLRNTKPQHIGILKWIDFGLNYFVKTDKKDKSISLLEDLLKQNDLSIKVFESLTYSLRNDKLFVGKLATRWFLSKEILLCKAVKDIISLKADDNLILIADTEQFSEESKGSFVFAAEKAVGWLFNYPLSAASFIVSLMDISPPDEIREMTSVLFDPLLISYPGRVREYLSSLLPDSSPEVTKALKKALSSLRIYHKGLDAAKGLPELLPSQAQRETYARLFNRRMRESLKKGEKNSIVALFPKTILLYGRKSIDYVYDSDGNANRMEMPLGSIEHSIEFPSLQRIDPHGLDYMLRVFSFKGCK